MSVSECIRKVCGRDCAAAGVSWAGGGAAQHHHHNNESIVRFKRLNPAVHRRGSSHQLPGKADAGNFPVREEAGSCGSGGQDQDISAGSAAAGRCRHQAGLAARCLLLLHTTMESGNEKTASKEYFHNER